MNARTWSSFFGAVLLMAGCSDPLADIEVTVLDVPDGSDSLLVESAVDAEILEDRVIAANNQRFILRIPSGSSGDVKLKITARDTGLCRLGNGAEVVRYEVGQKPQVAVRMAALKEAICTLALHAPPTGRIYSCPTGIACANGATCNYEFPRGQKIQLDTTALSRWEGDCAGLDTCELSLDRNMDVRASAASCTGDTCWIERSKIGQYVSDPYELSFRRMWGPAADDLWVVGDQGRRMHWNGACWSQYQDPDGPWKIIPSLMDIWGTGPDDIWSVGLTPGASILHYQAGTWRIDPASTQYQQLQGMHGLAKDDIWAVGMKGVVLHYDGMQWSAVSAGTTQDLYTVWAAGKNDVWIGGAKTLRHWDGTAWSDATIRYNDMPPPSNRQMIMTIFGTTPQNIWAAGMHSVILHYDGSSWQEDPRSQQDDPTHNMFRRLWGMHERHLWLTGTNCLILNFTGANWRPDGKSHFLKDNCYLEGVFGTSQNDVWLSGGGLNIPGLGARLDGLLMRYRP